MRGAPAVSFDLAAATPWRVAYCALASVAAAAAVAAILQHLSASSSASGASLALAAGAAALAGWRWCPFSQGRLRFDGEQWWFLSTGRVETPGLLHVMIDFGDRMLLRFDPDPACSPATVRRAWVPAYGLSATNAVALRAAVYCRRPESHLPSLGENPTR